MYGLRLMYGLHKLSSHRLAAQLNPLKFVLKKVVDIQVHLSLFRLFD